MGEIHLIAKFMRHSNLCQHGCLSMGASKLAQSSSTSCIRRTKGDASAYPYGGIVKVVVSPAEGQVMRTSPRCVA